MTSCNRPRTHAQKGTNSTEKGYFQASQEMRRAGFEISCDVIVTFDASTIMTQDEILEKVSWDFRISRSNMYALYYFYAPIYGACAAKKITPGNRMAGVQATRVVLRELLR